MRSTLFIALFVSVVQTAKAGDLLDTLRQLRGTVDEVTRTGRELSDLKNAVAPGSATQAQQPQQVQQPANAAGQLQAGDVLVGKIANVKVYREANKQAAALGQVSKSEELIYMGEEQNGLYKVTAPSGEGWVDKLLVRKN